MRTILDGEIKVLEWMDCEAAASYIDSLNTLYNLNRRQPKSRYQKQAEKKVETSNKASRECWGIMYDLRTCLSTRGKPSEEWTGSLDGVVFVISGEI